MQALISEARRKYHAGLLSNGILTIDGKGVPSNADRSSNLSIAIAQGICVPGNGTSLNLAIVIV